MKTLLFHNAFFVFIFSPKKMKQNLKSNKKESLSKGWLKVLSVWNGLKPETKALTPFPIILPLPIWNFLVCRIVGSSRGSSKTSKFSILLSLSTITSPVLDMTTTNCTENEHTTRKRKETNGKRGRIKRQRWSGGEENERQMANNVMRGIRVVMGTWYVLTWLDLA